MFPDFSSLLLKFISPILRSHEKQGKILGSTYFVTSSLLSIVFFPQEIAVASITFLVLGDLFAAIIGKKWGRIKIFSGKSFEGSLACFIICFFVSILVIRIKPVVGLFGAIAATIFELVPIGIDDNLTMPLTSGFVMWAIVAWMSL
jgi:glycerol-3-phosphate acyltransferase PlsY